MAIKNFTINPTLPFLSLLLSLSAFAWSCHTSERERSLSEPVHHKVEAMYSKYVQDTLEVYLQYPKSYSADSVHSYPLVVVTDADLYFPLLAPICHQYEEVGIWPPMVLVGVGYGSIERMDSLRNRDFLYPKALESDEIATDGGGEHFYQFLTRELLPDLQHRGFTNAKRVLTGHSFGGYFTLFAHLKQMQEAYSPQKQPMPQAQDKSKRQPTYFTDFVSASPALWYHDFYLTDMLRQIPSGLPRQKSKLFISVGGEEDQTWVLEPFEAYHELLDSASLLIASKKQIYAGAEHMDVGLLSLIQGIGWLVK